MVTLSDCLKRAEAYWTSKGPSSRMMPIRARACMSILGGSRKVASLSAGDGTVILSKLGSAVSAHSGGHLGKETQAAYYKAFRRMLTLNGIATADWPKPGKPPRRVREPLTGENARRLQDWLALNGYPETDHLIAALMATGMRVEVEALTPSATLATPQGLKVIGKGGHERVIPLRHPEEVIRALEKARVVSYAGHLRRWNAGIKALGITSKKPTPHAVRHLYATKAYERTKDIHAVQELLGHADINTTARYIGVDLGRLRAAAGIIEEEGDDL